MANDEFEVGDVAAPESIQEDVDILGGEEDSSEEETESGESENIDDSGETEEVGDQEEASEEESPKPQKEAKVETKEETQEEEIPPGRYPRPSLKDIRSKYPNFFKDFPEIKNAMFREQAYTEVFPTVEDAVETAETASTFNWIQEDLLQGNSVRLLQSLASADAGAANKFIDNFLPTLERIDDNLYAKTVQPVVERFIRAMYEDGRRSGNANLANSALHALQFAGFEPRSTLTGQGQKQEQREPDPNLIRLAQERQQLVQQQRAGAHAAITNATAQSLQREVENALKSEKGISDFVRQTMAEKIMRELDDALGADEKHLGLMQSLWRRADRAGYSKEWGDRLISAYMSRAKTLLPAIRNKVRAQAMGQPNSRPANQKADTKQPATRFSSGKGNGPQAIRGSVEKLDPRRVDWRNTSDLDILEDKAKVRR